MKTRLTKQSLRNKATQQGFTLIELLVASALSLIIISAVGAAYLKTRVLNQSNVQRINAQQEARTALNMMAYTIRNAGSYGCYSYNDSLDQNSFTRKDALPAMQTFFFNPNGTNRGNNNVRILSAANLAATIAGFNNQFGDIKGNAIAIQGAYSVDYTANAEFSKFSSTDKSASNDIANNAWVVIADCQHAKLVNLTGGNGTNSDVVNKGQFLLSTTTVRTYSEYVYFVGTQTATGRKGLFRLELTYSANGAAFDLTRPQLLVGVGTFKFDKTTTFDEMSLTATATYLDVKSGEPITKACEAKSVDSTITTADGKTETVATIEQKTKLSEDKGDLSTPVLVDVIISMQKSNGDIGKTISYPITTTIRGANVCANVPNLAGI